MSTTKKSDRIEVLLNEYNYVCNTINEFVNEQFKVLNAGILIYSAAFIYGLSDSGVENNGNSNSELILIFIPIAVLTLMNYLLYRLERNSFLQAYRVHLETEINTALTLTESPTIFYGSLAKDKLRAKNSLSLAQIGYYALFYLVSMVVGLTKFNIVKSYDIHCCFYIFLMAVYYCILILAPILYFFKIWNISYRTEEKFSEFTIKHSSQPEHNEN